MGMSCPICIHQIMSKEMFSKFFYEPLHYTCTLVLYKLDNNFPIILSHRKHMFSIKICLVQNLKMAIELECNIFTLVL
jgi:hypothetical protein